MWIHKFQVAFTELARNLEAEDRHSPKVKALFHIEYLQALRKFPWSSDLSQSRKLSRVSGGYRFWSVRGVTRLVAGGGLLPMELGTNSVLLVQVLTNLAACSKCVASSRLGFQNEPHSGRGMEETAVQPSTTACGFACFGVTTGNGRLVLLDVGEKHAVFLAILVVARMVIWTTRKKR